MKISLKWLNEYVDVSEFLSDPSVLVEKLTAAGLEVEGVESQAQNMNQVVVGKVEVLDRHPDADRLTLCQVDIGTGQLQQIICGATNHKQGDKVAVALPGAILPGDFAIKKSKIRGVESNGMLCSEVELGLADESPGIMILPKDAPVGEPFATYHGCNDVLMELKVTPNRADCLSHWGLAREVSCLFDRPLKFPAEEPKTTGQSTKDHMSLQILDAERCPRYAGRSILGVKVGPSPDWLKKRVESIGLNSINNVVDVTNFVMMELGQPLHAFDAGQIAGRTIKVGPAEKGEKFITLDGTELNLTGEELMIRDGEKAVAMAGVIGGVNSGVTEETSELFIESAYFTMGGVRRSSRLHGIETDSGYRFTRGVDPSGTLRAMNRACELIQKVAGGNVAEDHYDEYPQAVERSAIEVSVGFVAQKLGYQVDRESFVQWMKRLGCEMSESQPVDNDRVALVPPAFRWDLEMAEDFVEEYARLNGYDQIPETLPALVTEPPAHVKSYQLDQSLNHQLQGLGFQQAVNYAFLDSETQNEVLGDVSKLEAFGVGVLGAAVRLKNPLSEELSTMRSSLIPGLLKNIAANDRQGIRRGRMYESGFVFGEKGGEYLQSQRVSLAIWGQNDGLNAEKAVPVFELKSRVENLLLQLKSRSFDFRPTDENSCPDFLHPGQSAGLFFEGKIVGVVGTLHPLMTEKFKVKSPVAMAEIDFDSLMRGQPRWPKSKTPSKFPFVERDLAFLMPSSLQAGKVLSEIRKAAGKTLVDAYVFDVYEGKNVEEGHRSVAFRLRYQGEGETLSDDQILGLQSRVINSVGQKFSISVR